MPRATVSRGWGNSGPLGFCLKLGKHGKLVDNPCQRFRSGRNNADKARIKELERENKELRTANEILKKASAYFAQAELDRLFSR